MTAPGQRPLGYQPLLEAEILRLSPVLYAPCQDIGTANPTNLGSGGATLSMNDDYVWSNQRFLPNGSTAIDARSAVVSLSARQGLTGNQTRLCWIKTSNVDSTTSYAGNPAATILGDTTGNVWDNFGVHAGLLEYRRFNNTAWQTFTSTKVVSDMGTHMIAATYDSSSRAVELYVDGEDDGGGTMTAHQAQGGINRIFIGFGSADNYTGQAAHIAVWSSVLTPAQIKRLWDVSQER